MLRAKTFGFYLSVDCPETGSHTIYVTVEHLGGSRAMVSFARDFDDYSDLGYKDMAYLSGKAIEEADRRIKASAALSKAYKRA